MLRTMCIALIYGQTSILMPTDRVTLTWVHTVERTPWEEDYIISGGVLAITEGRIKRSGAGMDAPTGAIWSDGWWHYRPATQPLREVILANSSFAPGYSLCWGGRCHLLREFVPADVFVKLTAANCVSGAK
jgi:hypothetical protein